MTVEYQPGDAVNMGIDDCPFCAGESTMESESENHFGTEYYFQCCDCEGKIHIEITHIITQLQPPTEDLE